MKTRWRAFVGITFTGIFSVLFLYQVDLGEMIRAISQANFYMVIPALVAYVIALGLRTIRWGLLLNPLGTPKFSQLFWVVVVGYMANNLLPARLGEFARAYLLSERFGHSKSATLGTIALERAGDLLTLMGLAVAALTIFPSIGILNAIDGQFGLPWQVFTVMLGLPLVIGMASLVLFLRYSTAVSMTIGRLAGSLHVNFEQRAVSWFLQFVDGLSVLRKPRSLILILILSVSIWIFEAFLYLFIAIALDVHTVFASSAGLCGVILLTTAISNLATAIPSSQGGIGPFEFFTKETIVLAGVGIEVASAYALVVHATLLIPITLVGLAHLWKAGLTSTVFPASLYRSRWSEIDIDETHKSNDDSKEVVR